MYRKRYETLGNAIKYHRVAAHPSLDLIFAIADALEVHVNELWGQED